MTGQTALGTALGGHNEVPDDWMSATQVRPFLFGDPAVVWLRFHGEQHGLLPDQSPYDFLSFIGEKGRQFESKWLSEMAPGAVRVCGNPWEARSAEKAIETFELMQSGTPVIAQPALWWAPEQIYGVPDILIHTSWLVEHLPAVGNLVDPEISAAGHYIVFDLKFTTQLEKAKKAKDLEGYSAQVRLYSYMLGQLQGLMPADAYLVTRDRISDPLPVPVHQAIGGPLDEDLAAIRDWYLDIKLNGAAYTPWEHEVVASNLKHDDERWKTGKRVIAEEKTPGRDRLCPARSGRLGGLS